MCDVAASPQTPCPCPERAHSSLPLVSVKPCSSESRCLCCSSSPAMSMPISVSGNYMKQCAYIQVDVEIHLASKLKTRNLKLAFLHAFEIHKYNDFEFRVSSFEFRRTFETCFRNLKLTFLHAFEIHKYNGFKVSSFEFRRVETDFQNSLSKLAFETRFRN